MKTFTAVIEQNPQLQTTKGQKLVPAVAASAREILALLSAATAATIIVMLVVWLAGLEISNILGAASWGLGLIFLGLAVDNREPTAFLQLITGVALLALAGLQSRVSPDYIIFSGVIVAIWVAAVLLRRLR